MLNLDFIFGFISGLGITTIVVALIENKYHIINRIRKQIAIMKNSGTNATLSLEYEIKKPFSEIIEEFKNIFRNSENFKVEKKTDTKARFQYKTISINLIQNAQGNLFIEVDKIGCGIRNLKEKINEFLGKVRQIEKNKIVSEFICCDLTFSLPYKWDNLNIWTPKGLEVKKYNIGFSEKNYKSEIEISLNKVNINSDTLQSLTYIIEKFV